MDVLGPVPPDFKLHVNGFAGQDHDGFQHLDVDGNARDQ
jgi:hypothetical protein